jgi:hypothetical protein
MYWAVPITMAKPQAKPGAKVPNEEPMRQPQDAAESEDIMIYDPLSGSVVNKYVYTIENMPPFKTGMLVDGFGPLGW